MAAWCDSRQKADLNDGYRTFAGGIDDFGKQKRGELSARIRRTIA
jgi:hypothetical protein